MSLADSIGTWKTHWAASSGTATAFLVIGGFALAGAVIGGVSNYSEQHGQIADGIRDCVDWEDVADHARIGSFFGGLGGVAAVSLPPAYTIGATFGFGVSWAVELIDGQEGINWTNVSIGTAAGAAGGGVGGFANSVGRTFAQRLGINVLGNAVVGGTAQSASNLLNRDPVLENVGRSAALSGGFAGLSYSTGAALSRVNGAINGSPGSVRTLGDGPYYDYGRQVPPAWFGANPPVTSAPLRPLPPVHPTANAIGNVGISIGEGLIGEGSALVPADE